MKVIALVPVRNEAWVLEHSLASLSTFCDVVIVSDQGSTDGSQDICRRFPKVVLLDTTGNDPADRLPVRARWRLLDAARGYDGNNLLWCTDADELISPSAVQAFLVRERDRLTAPRAISCRYYHAWRSAHRYRNDLSQYGPGWKVIAVVDDRKLDYPRALDAPPLHEPRTPWDDDPQVLQAEDLKLFHLQYAVWQRNQMKQAWYRSLEWLDACRATAGDINTNFYSITMAPAYDARNDARCRRQWLDGTRHCRIFATRRRRAVVARRRDAAPVRRARHRTLRRPRDLAPSGTTPRVRAPHGPRSETRSLVHIQRGPFELGAGKRVRFTPSGRRIIP